MPLVPRLIPLMSLPLVAAMALTAGPAAAHPPGPGGAGGPHHPMLAPRATVTVTGEGQATVAPDMATVAIGVTTQAPTAAQAMADNAARQAAVIDAARAQGLAAEDLQTQGLNLSPLQDYSREGQAPAITGYQAQNIVTARVRDLSRLGPLLDALVNAGATDVQGISFSRDDDAAARDKAREAAVTDARRRAEVMARAAGVTLGPLLTLTEGINQGGPAPVMMMARDAKASGATPVEAGQLILTTQVTGVWALIASGDASDVHGARPMSGEAMHGHGPSEQPAPAAPDAQPVPQPSGDTGAAAQN